MFKSDRWDNDNCFYLGKRECDGVCEGCSWYSALPIDEPFRLIAWSDEFNDEDMVTYDINNDIDYRAVSTIRNTVSVYAGDSPDGEPTAIGGCDEPEYEWDE